MKSNHVFLVIVILIAATFAAFSPILKNDFVNYDDNRYLTENPFIKTGINAKSLAGLAEGKLQLPPVIGGDGEQPCVSPLRLS